MFIAYTVIVILGFVPLVITLSRIRAVKRMKEQGTHVMGTIREVSGSTGKSLNSAIIQYTIVETGESVGLRITVAGMPYQIGQQLPLYYNKQNPADIQLDSGKGFIFQLIFTGLIALFSIAACFLIQHSINTGEL
ncbi:DUF3592 domain-containing protein [Salmonirosea aquatica]|uniref:DUF3592 domain-containing protein n=1 Tax=Salmonirosea aquatica TaxID=2654236 RepID=A0A7C9FRK6_9BACT|nr:DUF3592 domain-containing protein [Cytophagaceae bacterium SJW1-29]